MNFLSQFIDSNKLGGWVRALVAAGLGLLIGKFPGLDAILDPATQQALGVAVAGAVVGLWSQLTKTDTAKLEAVAAMPDERKQAAFSGISDQAKISAVVELAKDPNSSVQGVITTSDAAGKAMAASIPGPIVAAGTSSATDIAKA